MGGAWMSGCRLGQVSFEGCSSRALPDRLALKQSPAPALQKFDRRLIDGRNNLTRLCDPSFRQ